LPYASADNAANTKDGRPMNDGMRSRKVWPNDYQGADDVGLKCPKCHCKHIPVLKSRNTVGDTRYRRRECRNCGHKFTTYER